MKQKCYCSTHTYMNECERRENPTVSKKSTKIKEKCENWMNSWRGTCLWASCYVAWVVVRDISSMYMKWRNNKMVPQRKRFMNWTEYYSPLNYFYKLKYIWYFPHRFFAANIRIKAEFFVAVRFPLTNEQKITYKFDSL